MKKIGELLMENDLLSRQELQQALDIQQNEKEQRPIGEILVSLGAITIETLSEYLDIQLKRFKR